MTPAQRMLVRALGNVRFPLGPRADRRIVRHLGVVACADPAAELTPRQLAFLLTIVHRYRRQLPTTVLIVALEEAERLAARHPGALSRKRRVVAVQLRFPNQLLLPFPAGRAGGGTGVPAPGTARGNPA